VSQEAQHRELLRFYGSEQRLMGEMMLGFGLSTGRRNAEGVGEAGAPSVSEEMRSFGSFITQMERSFPGSSRSLSTPRDGWDDSSRTREQEQGTPPRAQPSELDLGLAEEAEEEIMGLLTEEDRLFRRAFLKLRSSIVLELSHNRDCKYDQKEPAAGKAVLTAPYIAERCALLGQALQALLKALDPAARELAVDKVAGKVKGKGQGYYRAPLQVEAPEAKLTRGSTY